MNVLNEVVWHDKDGRVRADLSGMFRVGRLREKDFQFSVAQAQTHGIDITAQRVTKGWLIRGYRWDASGVTVEQARYLESLFDAMEQD
jgi:hypothetical protein